MGNDFGSRAHPHMKFVERYLPFGCGIHNLNCLRVLRAISEYRLYFWDLNWLCITHLPVSRAAIEQQSGVRLADADPKMLAFIVDR